MRKTTFAVPVPDRLHDAVRDIERRLRGKNDDPALDLSGDRTIEWSWTAARIPDGEGEALDFGCGQSDLGLIAAHRGFHVTAVDLEPVIWPYVTRTYDASCRETFSISGSRKINSISC